METKKKILVSMTSMGLAVAAAVGVTFGVLAAQNQAVNSSITVSYQANNVSATMTANYQTKNGSDTALVNAANTSSTQVVFTPTSESTTGSLQVGSGNDHSITLTAIDNYVILKNEFTNNATAGGRYLVVTFQNDYLTATNCTIKYFPSNYGGSGVYETYEKIDEYGEAYSDLTQTTLYIAPQESFYIYTLIEIENVTLDASVSVAANVTPFALTTATEVSSDWTNYVNENQAYWGVALYWSDYAATSYAGGDGTQAHPYQISTAAQLAKLAVDVNTRTTAPTYEYYELTNDIDLLEDAGYNWVPIGCDFDLQGYVISSLNPMYDTASNPSVYHYFYGSFDGNDYTISGMFVASSSENEGASRHDPFVGLFGVAVGDPTFDNQGNFTGLTGYSYIKNLSVDGSVACVGSAAAYIGGITGGALASQVINCHNYAAFEIETGNPSSNNSEEVEEIYYVGGVCGGAVLSQVKKCSNRQEYQNQLLECFECVAMAGDTMFGGVVGGTQYSQVSECFNLAVITFVSGGDMLVGGIVGGDGISTTISNCYNKGLIEGTDFNFNSSNPNESSGSFVYVGGIVGSSGGTVSYCYNSGLFDVTYIGVTNVAGIVGGRSAWVDTTITNCFNLGTAFAKETSFDENGHLEEVGSHAVSIVGIYGDSNGEVMSSIANCYYVNDRCYKHSEHEEDLSVTSSGKVSSLSTLMKNSSNFGTTSFGTYTADDNSTGDAAWSQAWDFEDTWMINSSYNGGLPTFKYLYA